MHVPLARALHVPDNQLKGLEIEGRDRIEGDVEENEGPLEEGIGCVSWLLSVDATNDKQSRRVPTSGYPVDLVLDEEVD